MHVAKCPTHPRSSHGSKPSSRCTEGERYRKPRSVEMTAKTSSLASMSARNKSPPPLPLRASPRGEELGPRGEELGELIMLAESESWQSAGKARQARCAMPPADELNSIQPAMLLS